MASFPEGLHNRRMDDILNAVDRLRHIGVGKNMHITQILVIGDQSAGKSSVLEAIAGVQFPQSKGCCTLFPTEIVMRREKSKKISLTLVPYNNASSSEVQKAKEMLDAYKSVRDLKKLPEIIINLNKALNLMGDERKVRKSFSKHTLKIEISGPDLPQLTLVDLPGLIQYPGQGQTCEDVKVVREMVSKYVQNPKAIVLAIISALTDVQNQSPMSVLNEKNALGRTLAIITKLDVLDPEDTAGIINEVQHIPFGIGWHALRNRKPAEMNVSQEERDSNEADYFEEDQWSDVDNECLGVVTLRSRLASTLYKHLAEEVPRIVEMISAKHNGFEEELRKLGPAIKNDQDKLRYLIDVSFDFNKLANDALNGLYGGLGRDANRDELTEEELAEAKKLRLLAQLEEHNMFFANQVREYGVAFIFPDMWDSVTNDIKRDPEMISEAYFEVARKFQKSMRPVEAAKWAVDALRISRGRELATSHSSNLVKDLYEKLSRNWTMLASWHVEQIDKLCRNFFVHLLKKVTTDDLAHELETSSVGPALRGRRKMLDEGLKGVLRAANGQPNTHDPKFLEVLETLTRKRSNRFFGRTSDEQVALRALDEAMAYYIVQVNWFAESITKLVIGDCLLRDIAEEILSPKSVIRMKPTTIDRLVAEDDKTTRRRNKLLKYKDDASEVIKLLSD